MSTAKPNPPVANPSTKTKGPSAPSYEIKDSLEDVRKLYDAFGRGYFTIAELASTLKIGAASGVTKARVYTYKTYGFLDKTGEKFKVTESFIELKLAEPNSPSFKRMAYAAILKSGLFKDLISGFGSKLPPVPAIAIRLEGQKKFAPARAKAIAELLDASLRQVGVIDANGNIVPQRDDEAGEPADETLDDESDIQAGREESSAKILPPPTKGFLRTEVPLKEGRHAVVHYPADLSEEEATKIGAVLRAVVS